MRGLLRRIVLGGVVAVAPLAEAAVPGLVEARWTDGETKWTTSGFADIEAGRPAATNDLFWIASNTKGVAAALVLTFVDEGKIGLDDPVARYFPEWSGICVVKDGLRQPASVPPTVRMLLSHQAGLDFFPGMPIDRYSVRELVTEAVRRGLVHEPGSRWKYSNWGIDVAVAIAEKVGGKPWETLLKERILDPLEMRDTCFWPTDEQLRRLEVPYFLGKDGRSAPVRIGTVNQFRGPYGDRTRRAEAGGGLFSTVPDMLAFAQMVARKGVGVNGRRILSESICEEWYRAQTRPDEPGLRPGRCYSFGMDVDPERGTICHGGAYGTHIAVNWKTRSCRVTFVQRAKNGPKDGRLPDIRPAESAAVATRSRPMKARVIQPLYLKGEQAAYECLDWELGELAKCDESLDLVVLPEASDVQALMPDTETYGRVVARNHGRLMEACAATARRCKAVVFVNGVDTTPEGWVNTTFAFDTSGRMVGKYAKQHLVPSEQRRFGRAATAYTREWNEPYVIAIDGVRYAFLTCYDFYFYEGYAAIAREKPDVVIGCSHQRSDKLEVLEFINQFCAYNTAAYLVRASVSMGLDSPLGGSSMVVAPDGRILGNMKSGVGHLDVTFDPFAKYLKPAGYGNPPATHPEYVEKGRRPWKYRPGGSAIVPGFADTPAERPTPLEAGPSAAGNTLATLGAAAATGVPEAAFDVEVRDGKIVTPDGVAFADILRRLSCHLLMDVRRKGGWTDADVRRLEAEIHRFDAEGHVRIAK